ncbi:unnamed protein product [Heligmosomoides polygyrus]|uniref:RING-type domain-containing protein n=1 Tax=Heligmosomoides polygyrus TaxID=6339 RepID=A0A183GVB9_HELPZ|nr:unnamed protein product [Heligmosomoides polygyrus]
MSKNEVSRSLRRLSSLPADFCCSICMNIFRKPSMLSCGHSFCADCIQHWLSENVSCPTCRTDTRVPIRNIALEQVRSDSRNDPVAHSAPVADYEKAPKNIHLSVCCLLFSFIVYNAVTH